MAASQEEQLAALDKALDQVSQCKQEILDQQATVESRIQQESQKLVDTIKTQTSNHISKLQNVTEGKLKELASQREQIEAAKTQLSSEKAKELVALVQTNKFEPLTQADMDFVATDKAGQDFGEVITTNAGRYKLTGEALKVATVGEKATVILQVFDSKGQPCDKPVQLPECELFSEVTGTRVKGSVEKGEQSQFQLSYKPSVKGRHQLYIRVDGKDVRGSPFSVLARSEAKKLTSTPILTISQVKHPSDVVINQKGEIVVCEWGGNCISTFSPNGAKIRSFGSEGSGQGRFINPSAIAIDGEGNILVADTRNHRVQKFTADNKFLAAVGKKGSGFLEFDHPRGITCYGNKVYVADTENHRIQVLNSDLTFYGSFKLKGGEAFLRLNFDSAGKLYVADTTSPQVHVLTAEGESVAKIGKEGSGKGELKEPSAVFVDASDMVYVVDKSTARVSVFTSQGKFVTSFGWWGSKPGGFVFPSGLAVDHSGIVYVCDQTRVQLF